MTCQSCGAALEREHRLTYALERAMYVDGTPIARFAPVGATVELCDYCADRAAGLILAAFAAVTTPEPAGALAEARS